MTIHHSDVVEPVPGLRAELGRAIDRYIAQHPLRWIEILRTLDDVQQRITEKVLRS